MTQRLREIYNLYLKSVTPTNCQLNILILSMNQVFGSYLNNFEDYNEHNNKTVVGIMRTGQHILRPDISPETKFIKPGEMYQIRIIFFRNSPAKMRIYFSGKGWNIDRPKMEFIDFLENLKINHKEIEMIFEKHIFEHIM